MKIFSPNIRQRKPEKDKQNSKTPKRPQSLESCCQKTWFQLLLQVLTKCCENDSTPMCRFLATECDNIKIVLSKTSQI
jgi:hypothetical protein